MNKNTTISAIIIAIVGVGAFYGGVAYEKNKLSPQESSRGGNMSWNSQRQNGAGGNRTMRPGEDNSSNGFLSGEILSKDDKSITIKTREGGSKIIFFSDSTAVGKSVDGSIADLNAGEQVMVSGKANSDGSLSAQNIQIRPAQPVQ